MIGNREESAIGDRAIEIGTPRLPITDAADR